jgi:hypothetical protein
MRPLDPRWQKTIAIIWLAVFGFWLGGLDEKAAYDAHYWLMSAVFVMGIAGAAYIVLHDDWKSKAVFVILLVSSSISIGGVDARGSWSNFYWLMTAALVTSIGGCAYKLLRAAWKAEAI